MSRPESPCAEARRRGEKFYLPISPCSKGNRAPRYVSNSRCTCEEHQKQKRAQRVTEVAYHARIKELRAAAPINNPSPLHGYFVGLYARENRAKK